MADPIKEIIINTTRSDELATPDDFTSPDEIYDILLEKIKVYHPSDDFSLIEKAYHLADDAHQGQKRKSGEPYIIHPLCVAIILAELEMDKETIIAGLLHDVIEDCGKTTADLPVCDEAKEIVQLLSHPKTTDENRDEIMNVYYKNIAANPKAAVVMCIDRCSNLTTMSWGLSRDRIYRMIKETEQYFPALIKVLKATTEYNNAAWLLQYQMESMLDIYKRLM